VGKDNGNRSKVSRYAYWQQDDNCRLNNLTKQSFFQNCLLPDILTGTVFPAIRGKKIDFYFLGRKLCSFNGNTFQANVAYLAAFKNRPKGEITEDDFRGLKVCESFEDGYTQIKKHVSLFEQPESGGVFKLCKAHSCYRKEFAGPIGVLDIELSLESKDEERSQDRIDLVLFHLKEKRLRFFEVKTFENKEIWPTNDHVPVAQQIQRYKGQLEDRKSTLLDGYKQYVQIMQHLCGSTLPEPISLDTDVDLLLIGFDTNQLKTIKSVLLPVFDKSFRSCLISGPQGATAGTLTKWWKNRN
jgi:hypothetical protein